MTSCGTTLPSTLRAIADHKIWIRAPRLRYIPHRLNGTGYAIRSLVQTMEKKHGGDQTCRRCSHEGSTSHHTQFRVSKGPVWTAGLSSVNPSKNMLNTTHDSCPLPCRQSAATADPSPAGCCSWNCACLWHAFGATATFLGGPISSDWRPSCWLIVSKARRDESWFQPGLQTRHYDNC
jgi:hypothetical protein